VLAVPTTTCEISLFLVGMTWDGQHMSALSQINMKVFSIFEYFLKQHNEIMSSCNNYYLCVEVLLSVL